jgi:hypothetical protein
MAPFLPVATISRSQNIRLGRGPMGGSSSLPNELNLRTVSQVAPQSGQLICAYYANLGDVNVKRDLQHHQAIGSLIVLGSLTNTYSDLFRTNGLAVTAGTGFAVNVAAGGIQSRAYGSRLPVVAQVVTPAAPSAIDRTDLLVLTNAGIAAFMTGAIGVTPVYEVDSVVTTGVPTGGTFTLSFTYDGQNYTTAPIAFNASAATVATAVVAATGGDQLPGTLTGTGGALPTAVTLTASGALEGPITNQFANYAALTGGTNPTVAFTQTTAGTGGAQAPTPPGGKVTPLAEIFIPSTATTSGNYTITNVALTA